MLMFATMEEVYLKPAPSGFFHFRPHAGLFYSRPADVKLEPQAAQQVADGSTWATYVMATVSGALLWFDHHASGLMALAALFTAAVNWWYRREAYKSQKWDGQERRREPRT